MLDLGCAGDMAGALEAAHWVARYTQARRAGDHATAAEAHRYLWDRGRPVEDPREFS
jgi:predicted metal-dependent hydrolase